MPSNNDDDFATQMSNLTLGLIGAGLVGAARLLGKGIDHASGNRVGNCAVCGSKVKYNINGTSGGGVIFCNTCMDYFNFVTRPEEYETTDPNYVMPGMRKTLAQLGFTEGKHHPKVKNGRLLILCDAFEGRGSSPNAMHMGWYYDPYTGDVEKLHQHPDDMEGD